MKSVPDYHNFPGSEETVLNYWNEIDAFKTSLKRSEGRPVYSFYDGPPFATGLPHYGHILAGTIKDVVTRYAHQTGHYVERRFGWDCHGLPIEFEIDKMLGLKTKEDILAYGIGNYNEECRKVVMKYSTEWEQVVTRLGRWIDFKNDYKTMDLNFMESVWWVFAEIFKKNLVYRGFKVMPYSTKCTTPLSNFESNMSYKQVRDPAVTVSFPLKNHPDRNLIAWTTTPWTLPSNLALCVHPKLEYCLIKENASGKMYYICKALVSSLYATPDLYTVVEELKGKDLEGMEYVPLFNYFVDSFPNAFKVVCDDYVSDSSGTGIVHQAPGFGEDDFRVCVRENICTNSNVPCPVNDDGLFEPIVAEYKGLYIKDADPLIIKKIKEDGRLVKRATIDHSYPFCWRSDTPLIYKAVPSWFVKVTSFKDDLVKNNKESYWVPDFVKEKRFHNWLLDARDWSISRNRFWGTPLPLWVSDDYEEVIAIGSIKELEELSGRKITDLHRHFIDDIEIPSKTGRGTLKRVPEVFDCWFESGSMPYAQQHYPFENKDKFEKSFPADFIAEGVDQTRGWFYTLLVLSTALFNKPPFKNLIVNGLVLAEDRKKMSKRLKNYPDPMDVIHKYGADALRLYLINSPVVNADTLAFKETGVKDVIKDLLNKWYNAYKLLTENILAVEASTGKRFLLDDSFKSSDDVLDKWILSSLQSLVKFVREEMAAYRLYTVVPKLVSFIEDLTNWYVRLNRNRIKGKNGLEDSVKALSVLGHVLLTLCTTMAPFTPYFVEYIYLNLRHILPENQREDSVHYLDFPCVDESLINVDIEVKVKLMQEIIESARTSRDATNSPIRKPLRYLFVYVENETQLRDVQSLESYFLSELNIKELKVKQDAKDEIEVKIQVNWNTLGKRLKGAAKQVSTALSSLPSSEIANFKASGQIEVIGHVLTSEDVFFFYEFKGTDTSRTYHSSGSESKLVVVIDTTREEELETEHFVAEVLNRIQRLRKEAKLKVTDNNVVALYSFTAKASGKGKAKIAAATPERLNYLKSHVQSKHDIIFKKTNTKFVHREEETTMEMVLIEKATDLTEGIEMTLTLCVSSKSAE